MNLRKNLSLLGLCGILAFSSCKKENSSEPIINNKPTLERVTANSQETFTEGTSRLECVVKDDDNSPLSYFWDKDGGYFDANDEKIAVWHAPKDTGDYHVTVRVEDREEEWSASRTIQLKAVSRFDTLYATDDAYTLSTSPDLNSNREHYFFPFLIEVYVSPDWGLEEIYLNFPQISKEARSINLKLTRSSDGDSEQLRCYLFEISEEWSENVITYRNRPRYDELPKKIITFPIIDVNKSLYVDVTDIDLEHGIMISPIESGTSRSFYSNEGAQREGIMSYAPSLIVEYK